MFKKNITKQPYVEPMWKVISVDPYSMICTSVTVNPGSTEEDGGNDQEIDGGEIEL